MINNKTVFRFGGLIRTNHIAVLGAAALYYDAMRFNL